MGSWSTSVGVAKGYGLDGWSSIPGRDNILFSIPQFSRPALMPVKLLGREADITHFQLVLSQRLMDLDLRSSSYSA
jgi:hypothetical protein